MTETIKKDNDSQISESKILEDKKISIAIMSSFVILTIQYLILVYFNLMGTAIGQMVQLTSKAAVGFFYLLALPSVLRRNKVKFIGIYFVALFVFISNYAFFSENRIHLKPIIFPLFFTCLPSFIYAYSINDWDVLIETMKKLSKVVFFTGVIIGILVFTGNRSVGTYSMSLSYYMLLPAIIYMNDFMDNMSFKNAIVLAVSLLVIFALGSRGAIMCIGVFIILKLSKSLKGITYTKIFLYLIIFSAIITGVIFLNEIFEYIYNFLLNYGINSRTIRLFLQGGVYLSGRDRLYRNVMNEIINNPLIGIGLAGDRCIIGKGYVHNIFIEIFANFGMIVGALISITMLYMIVKSLFISSTEKYNMVIIWLSIGFVELFVSGSYLTSFKFWIFLGLILRLLFNKKGPRISKYRSWNKIVIKEN